jgi:hypothetical protein
MFTPSTIFDGITMTDPIASGNTLVTASVGGYKVYKWTYAFNSPGSFTPTKTAKYEIFMVGSGGYGGQNAAGYGGGGGGGGGIVKEIVLLQSGSTYSIQVGRSLNTGALPDQSIHSKIRLGGIDLRVALGGGNGGMPYVSSPNDWRDGGDGGSGGGAGQGGSDGKALLTNFNIGFNGGGWAGFKGGGGGGASQQGGNANGNQGQTAGIGGAGITNNWMGPVLFYAAGGGGGNNDRTYPGPGGIGGSSIGGSGASDGNFTAATNPVADRGAGGGGGTFRFNETAGSSGVVMIRINIQ